MTETASVSDPFNVTASNRVTDPLRKARKYTDGADGAAVGSPGDGTPAVMTTFADASGGNSSRNEEGTVNLCSAKVVLNWSDMVTSSLKTFAAIPAKLSPPSSWAPSAAGDPILRSNDRLPATPLLVPL